MRDGLGGAQFRDKGRVRLGDQIGEPPAESFGDSLPSFGDSLLNPQSLRPPF
jgi:hypothetical protein